jgi:hypothetical protein
MESALTLLELSATARVSAGFHASITSTKNAAAAMSSHSSKPSLMPQTMPRIALSPSSSSCTRFITDARPPSKRTTRVIRIHWNITTFHSSSASDFLAVFRDLRETGPNTVHLI